MGRRSVHTADELRELILKAAEEIIDKKGLTGLSAREIARRIGYSPGTLYNMFENLDDLILHVEARLLDQLDRRLHQSVESVKGEEAIRRLARAYLEFTHERPQLWNLIFEHNLPSGASIPESYSEKLNSPCRRFEDALQPITDYDSSSLKRAARALWAGIHGVTALSTAEKLSTVSTNDAHELLDNLLETYLAGLEKA